MTKIRLRYIHEFVDRHGKVRRYVRLPGRKRVPLPALPEPPSSCGLQELRSPARFLRPGWCRSHCARHDRRCSRELLPVLRLLRRLLPRHARVRRNILERFRTEHRDKRVALLQRAHIDRMVAAKVGTPSAARNFLDTIRALMRHCLDQGWRVDDPTQGVKRLRIKTEGFRTWTEADIAAFEAVHSVGTRARLALALLLYTAQRRSDVVRLGRRHVRDGVIQVRHQKMGVVVTPVLAAILEATPSQHLTDGKPFSPPGFTNWFRDMCKGPACRAELRRMAYLKPLADVSLRPAVPLTLSRASPATRACAKCRGIRQPPTRARMARSAIDTMASAFPITRTSNGKPE